MGIRSLFKKSTDESPEISRKEIETLLQAHIRRAWQPITEERAGLVTDSKFSGIPLLAEGEDWPRCGHCNLEMQLFLQLNADQLPVDAKHSFGPGILQVFYCTNLENNCEVESEAYFPFSNSTLLRVVIPDSIPAKKISTSPVKGAFEEKLICSWKEVDDFPHYEELEQLGITLTDEQSDAFYDIEEDYPRAGDKLRGWPSWVQGVEYPDCPDCSENMSYIFQIDSEDNLPYMFGDVGCSHITQCKNHPDRIAIAWACC